MRVLVFGDSITQGYWDVNGGWVNIIRKHYDQIQLQDLDHNDEPTFFNLGISADNSKDILGRVEAEIQARTRSHHPVKPVILIQIGINDSSKEPTDPQISPAEYEANLDKLIDIVDPLSSKIVLVGLSACNEARTLPVAWGEYYSNNTDIEKYEQIMKSVAERKNVDHIAVFQQFKEGLDGGLDLLEDGLHPNTDGHQLMADIILPKLEEILA